MNLKNEINSLRNEMKNYKIIATKKEVFERANQENTIKEKMVLTPAKIYQNLGKKKLNFKSDHQVMSIKAANFLYPILSEEKEKFKGKVDKNNFFQNTNSGGELNNSMKSFKNENHLRIRDIHNFYSLRTNLKLILFTVGFPIIFFFKISKLKSYYRYILFLPSIVSVGPMLEAVKNYVTNKYAFLMLMCIEKYYKEEKDIYERYKEFMRQNDLELIKINP